MIDWLPQLDPSGELPPGIHAATLENVIQRFGSASSDRQRQTGLLSEIVRATGLYPTIKRVLVWGSYVTAKAAPADLDYSLVVGVGHSHMVSRLPTADSWSRSMPGAITV